MASFNHFPGAGQAALRRGRVSMVGQVYLVTAVTHWRIPFFNTWATASVSCRILSQPQLDVRFVAWVLMPDHFHGLLQVGDHLSLPAVMQRCKGRIARAVNEVLGRTGPLWQHGYHDHALRREEAVEPIARYVIENPVRAGIVARVGDYPYWNTDWWE